MSAGDLSEAGGLSGATRDASAGAEAIPSFCPCIGFSRRLDRMLPNFSGGSFTAGDLSADFRVAAEPGGPGRIEPEMSYPPVGNRFGRPSRKSSRGYTLSGTGSSASVSSASAVCVCVFPSPSACPCRARPGYGCCRSTKGWSFSFWGWGRGPPGWSTGTFAAGVRVGVPGVRTAIVPPHLRQRTSAPLNPLIIDSFIR